MRIVSGSLGGRRLRTPKGSAVRPTADKVRQALFNILGDLEGLSVLDLFAGSGAISFEALSRGAQHATLVERGRPSLEAIEDNAATLRIPATAIEILRMPVERALELLARSGRRFDRIFADPPYTDAPALHPEVLRQAPALLEAGGLIVLEHARRDTPPIAPPGLRMTQSRGYGETALSFYAREGEQE
ncbi:MAG: 16S rRNA (guanine(966)-N(2))-methyltransferase RsmD [Deltaproteobacteria bacterium]|nr:16S rRNA (guanine(966)-N(2))-methyltransferase RsmD [Deltaproteobacteria bacterium]